MSEHYTDMIDHTGESVSGLISDIKDLEFLNSKLEQQLKEKEEIIKQLHESCRAYSKSSCDKGLQLKEAEDVIDYYLPILEERLACGAYARQHKNKWSDK